MQRTKYFTPLPPPIKGGKELFDELECRVITRTPRPRWPRRPRLGERFKAAWAAFWGAGR